MSVQVGKTVQLYPRVANGICHQRCSAKPYLLNPTCSTQPYLQSLSLVTKFIMGVFMLSSQAGIGQLYNLSKKCMTCLALRVYAYVCLPDCQSGLSVLCLQTTIPSHILYCTSYIKHYMSTQWCMGVPRTGDSQFHIVEIAIGYDAHDTEAVRVSCEHDLNSSVDFQEQCV